MAASLVFAILISVVSNNVDPYLNLHPQGYHIITIYYFDSLMHLAIINTYGNKLCILNRDISNTDLSLQNMINFAPTHITFFKD